MSQKVELFGQADSNFLQALHIVDKRAIMPQKVEYFGQAVKKMPTKRALLDALSL